ncbi:MAG: YkvA family protein [Acidobacteriota bacterium]|nr:YkvA family protein [Bryobacterales bacterium]MDE3262493.1 YkvA family protein [Acidobacteriota bacterium]
MKLPRFAHARARRLVESPRKLRSVIEKAQRKQESARTAHSLKRVLAELKTMLHLMQAWVGGKYTNVSNANLVLIVGAVVYFLVPTDLVPDFIPAFGLVDDAAVIAWVVEAVTDELAKFKEWRPTDEESTGKSRSVGSRA